MSSRYARLPNPDSVHDPEGELEAAFELDDEEDQDDQPLIRRSAAPTTNTTTHIRRASVAGPPGGYDFEIQDYDFPPPGSPPPPTSRALPNDFGNSNGLVPTTPLPGASSLGPQPSFFRRALGSFLPAQYSRLATSDSSSRRTVGGGTENDGVFANVMAKPQVGRVIHTEDGNMFVVPEDSQKEMPPSYAEAQADAVPPYWETTIHAPASLEPGAHMIIDDLPTGHFFIFALNFFISWFFQFVGFFLTYMLHTSHAAKFGSRAGLGLTLIQYGLVSRVTAEQEESGGTASGSYSSPYYNATSTADGDGTNQSPPEMPHLSQTSRDWLSFLFMTLGWFLLLSSCVGFWRVKRWEASVRTPPHVDPTSPEEIERDQAIRRNIANVFGITIEDNNVPDPHTLTPAQQAAIAAEARLTRDLRAAGLI